MSVLQTGHQLIMIDLHLQQAQNDMMTVIMGVGIALAL